MKSNFKVDCAHVAQDLIGLAREAVLTKNWRKGIDILQKSFSPRLSLDQVIAILEGTLGLSDALELVQLSAESLDPATKKYLELYAWQQAGVFRASDGLFYRPYAEVKSIEASIQQKVIENLKELEDCVSLDDFLLFCLRDLKQNTSDIHVMVDNRLFLFCITADPPFWYTCSASPKEALDQYSSHQKHLLLLDSGVSLGADFFVEAISHGVCYASMDVMGSSMLYSEYQSLENLTQLYDQVYEDAVQSQGEHFARDLSHIRVKELYQAQQIKEKVCAKATKEGGFLNLQYIDESSGATQTVQVPRLPFLHWARHAVSGNPAFKQTTLPYWDPISPVGIKMQQDSRMHSDWWIGSGFPPSAAYSDHPFNDAAWKYAYKLALKEGKSGVVLAGEGKIVGVVEHPQPNQPVSLGAIAVVPTASPAYELALLSACRDNKSGAVISEIGGKLAHLAVVSGEIGARLMVVTDALKTYLPGDLLCIDFNEGTIHKII